MTLRLLAVFHSKPTELAQFRRPELQSVSGVQLVRDDRLNQQPYHYPVALAQFSSLECAHVAASRCTLIQWLLRPIPKNLPYAQRTSLHIEVRRYRLTKDRSRCSRVN